MADAATAGAPVVDAGASGDGGVLGTQGDTAEGDAKGGNTSVLGDVSDDNKNGQDTKGGESKDGKPAPDVKLEIKLPDGLKIDEATLNEFTELAKGIGLDSENASKLVAWQHERVQKENAAHEEAWASQGETWANELQADKDFGGSNLPETVLNAKAAIRKYGGESAVKAMAEMGIGNHPELVKTFARIGRAMKEDSSDTGGGNGPPAATDEKSKLRQQYPSMFNDDGSAKY